MAEWPRSLSLGGGYKEERAPSLPPPPSVVQLKAKRQPVTKTRDHALRRVAAATNTNLFVAKAQQRAAIRAARKAPDHLNATPPRPAVKRSGVQRGWDTTPLQKQCDRDAAHAAAIERRKRELDVTRGRYGNEPPPVLLDDEENMSALQMARQRIRDERAETYVARPPTVEEVDDYDDDAQSTASSSSREQQQRRSSPAVHSRLSTVREAPTTRNSMESSQGSTFGPASVAQRNPTFADDAPECVGSPRRGRPSAPSGNMRTRGTSPFSEALARKLLSQDEAGDRRSRARAHVDVAAAKLLFDVARTDPHSGGAARAYEEEFASTEAATREPTLRAAAGLANAASESAHSAREQQRAHVTAMSDMGAMARAVGGLVSSATKTMELHENTHQRHTQHEGMMGAFGAWQSQAQQQLDASLRLQQQQMAATLADWRMAAGQPPMPPPSMHQQQQPPSMHQHQQPPHQMHPRNQQQQMPPARRYHAEDQPEDEPRRAPPPVPSRRSGVSFATDPRTRAPSSVPPIPQNNADLLERLWDKIGEIEDDEKSIVHRLETWERAPREPLLPRPPDYSDGGAPVSLPLGVVEGLFDAARRAPDAEPTQERQARPRSIISEEDTSPKKSPRKQQPQRVSEVLPLRLNKTVKVDGFVDGHLVSAILNHRDQVHRQRDLAEAELFNTGLTQAQIVEVLAEDLLERLVSDTATELNDILKDCSEGLIGRI